MTYSHHYKRIHNNSLGEEDFSLSCELFSGGGGAFEKRDCNFSPSEVELNSNTKPVNSIATEQIEELYCLLIHREFWRKKT